MSRQPFAPSREMMSRIQRRPAAITKILGSGLLLVAAAAFVAQENFVRGNRDDFGGHPAPASAVHDGLAHQMAAGRPAGITARKISEEKLAHVPGKTVTVEIVDFPPGAVAPEHHHAGSVTVYVLVGAVRSQIAGGPLLDYHVGESFFEPPGAVHIVAMNPSLTDPAKFMAIHIADDGAQLTTYH
jgi:quercetin dioxygenase-like cupin family protein